MADVSDLLNTLFSHQRKKNITVSGWKPKGTVPPQIKYISTYKIYCDIDTFQPDQYNNTDLVTEKNTVKALFHRRTCTLLDHSNMHDRLYSRH